MPSWTAPVDRASLYTVTNTDWNGNLGVNGNTAYLYGDVAWTNVASFTNSWVNFGSGAFSAGYRLVGNRVFLRGAIKSGTINTAAFTLPAGYRPTANINLVAVSNLAVGAVQILSSGVVTPAAGSNVWISFDGLSFDTLT